MKFKKGDVTKEVWAGEMVIECEYIDYIGEGRMRFYDRTHKCFRCVFWEYDEFDKKFILNGWKIIDDVKKLNLSEDRNVTYNAKIRIHVSD